ncbi:hypothetical protein Sste5346_009916 [Sporothrix stenoceras]|uniref:NAD(P)-binding protein n=1 Tax=Sporothrix stenoceras TaxID=5173 RepID=A0ABR3YI75_9PEZI
MDNVVLPETDFTQVIHRDTYPAIEPSRPELSQEGRTVVVAGGGTNIGKAIATSFGQAKAATVIIVGRRQAVLDEAAKALEATASKGGSATKYVGKAVDLTNDAAVDTFWDGLASDGVHVDVLVQCSGIFGQPKPLIELGLEGINKMMASNFKGPVHNALRFGNQADKEREKFFVYVSTNAINYSDHNWLAMRPDYILSKNTATYAFSLLADGVKADNLQILSYHPGMIYTDAWPPLGFTKDMLPFDEIELPGNFAVWAASKEARFLHGRYVYATWDVDELASAEEKSCLDTDHNYLRVGVVGLTDGGHRVK